MRIRDVALREIFDSRGNPTIEVSLFDVREKEYRASLPAGASRGSREATSFLFGEAKTALDSLRSDICKKEFSSVSAFDHELFAHDDTSRKERIGGNVALGLSVAFTRALSAERGVAVWELLREEFFSEMKKEETSPPRIFSNLINGGKHARTNLNIQEYLVITGGRAVAKEIKTLLALYRDLGAALFKKTKKSILPIGDEGGYALDFRHNFDPVTHLEFAINALGLEDELLIGLDVAASAFWDSDHKTYAWEGKKRNAQWLADWYANAFGKSKLLFSIEDPFHEDDAEHFRTLQNTFPEKLIIGDDLTTTHCDTIREVAKQNAISGVIIKPNQVGTVSEACASILAAHSSGLRAIVSHRSGETDDPFIIHLAKAGNVFGVKIGAPVRERMSKFNELIRLYE